MMIYTKHFTELYSKSKCSEGTNVFFHRIRLMIYTKHLTELYLKSESCEYNNVFFHRIRLMIYTKHLKNELYSKCECDDDINSKKY